MNERMNGHTLNTALTKCATNSNEAVWCTCSKRGNKWHLREKAESNRSHFTQYENTLKASTGWRRHLIQTKLARKHLQQCHWFDLHGKTGEASAAKQTRTVFFWATAQPVRVIPFRRFRTTYRFHLQGSRIPPPQKAGNCSTGFI